MITTIALIFREEHFFECQAILLTRRLGFPRNKGSSFMVKAQMLLENIHRVSLEHHENVVKVFSTITLPQCFVLKLQSLNTIPSCHIEAFQSDNFIATGLLCPPELCSHGIHGIIL